eukprot:TRINITY_DN5306_c0_g1_i1.p1 TRINITY_DN5306_c0_g1~~TRINITY_DN5306_c0_g1_i1.p1  ORF type:complete len:368 (-),score=71.97 TRINITY_DN5306_c0_g1_i1:42-1145(-)
MAFVRRRYLVYVAIFLVILFGIVTYSPSSLLEHSLSPAKDGEGNDGDVVGEDGADRELTPKKELKCFHNSLPSLDDDALQNGVEEPLDCLGIQRHIQVNFTQEKYIGKGSVKEYYLGVDTRNGERVAVARMLTKHSYATDFRSGGMTLAKLQPHPTVVRLVGLCLDETDPTFLSWRIVTPYMEYRSLENFDRVIGERDDLDEWCTRVNVALGLVSSFMFIHQGGQDHKNPFVMCDFKMSQFSLGANMEVVLTDTDAMPRVSPHRGVLCGSQKVTKEDGPPEAVWPHGDAVPFDREIAPRFNEKRDIWKLVPTLKRIFPDKSIHRHKAAVHLDLIYRRCRDANPDTRISASDLYHMIRPLLTMINVHE